MNYVFFPPFHYAQLKRKDPLGQDSSDVKRICPSPGLEQSEDEGQFGIGFFIWS